MQSSFTDELRNLFIDLLPLYIPKAHGRADTKVTVKDDSTPVTDVDTHTLAQLRTLIAQWFPLECTIGEEDRRSSEALAAILTNVHECQWTIDGLDGTWHFTRGTNSYGAMVSRRQGNCILYAAIFRPVDMALRGNGFFVARHGEGAFEWCRDCNVYERIRTADYDALERKVVLLEGSSKRFFTEPLLSLGKKITTRPSLSSCIAATTVARGDATALITTGNKPWDNWPVILMIEEAGGVVTDHQGNPYRLEDCGDIVAAANATDHAELIVLLNP